MKALWIASNTVREAFRNRVLYLLAVFSLLLVLGSVFFGLLTVGDEERVTQNIALAGISVFGMLITVFLGVQMVSKEVRERTIYTILAGPFGRSTYIIGKILGLFLVVVINAALMSAVMYAVLLLQAQGAPPGLLYAVGLTLIEFLIMISIAVLFSTFSTPILSAVLTATLYIIGHLSWGLKEFSSDPQYGSGPLRWVVRSIYYALPNLEYLNIRNEVIHGWRPPMDYLLTAAAYGVCYAAAVSALAILLFSRKDIR